MWESSGPPSPLFLADDGLRRRTLQGQSSPSVPHPSLSTPAVHSCASTLPASAVVDPYVVTREGPPTPECLRGSDVTSSETRYHMWGVHSGPGRVLVGSATSPQERETARVTPETHKSLAVSVRVRIDRDTVAFTVPTRGEGPPSLGLGVKDGHSNRLRGVREPRGVCSKQSPGLQVDVRVGKE